MSNVPPDVQERIWGSHGYRVFISHKATAKTYASDLKQSLGALGASCFVAHEDIHPTEEWQREIEAALMSMDAFIALMTEDFHDSDWTDQEVGYAYGRGVPIIAIRRGRDPYGFIGKFQALNGNDDCWRHVPKQIVQVWIQYPRMLDSYIMGLRKCPSYTDGNRCAELLPSISNLTEEQVQVVITSFNQNKQLRGSLGFNGGKPRTYGDGILPHLKRWTGREHVISDSGMIELKTT